MVNLFLSGNQVPVIHQPGFQLLWDFYFNLHSVYEGFLLSRKNRSRKFRNVSIYFFLHVSDQSHLLPELIYELTLSTVGSTRALFFRGGWVGSPPELVPSPGPGATQTNRKIHLNP